MESRTELATLDGPGAGQRLVVSLVQQAMAAFSSTCASRTWPMVLAGSTSELSRSSLVSFVRLQAALGLSEHLSCSRRRRSEGNPAVPGASGNRCHAGRPVATPDGREAAG